jgi:hypothetical protein
MTYREGAALARVTIIPKTNEERRSSDRRIGHSIEQPSKIWNWR